MKNYTPLVRVYFFTLFFILTLIRVHAVGSNTSIYVSHLSVNNIQNPTGIDDIPLFGWELSSYIRNTIQEAYEITVANDPDFFDIVWCSGEIESSQSINVFPDGLVLEPSRRYYWRVKAKDNFGNIIHSNELAYFDTGLMGDWGDAMRIRSGNFDYSTKKIFGQTIQMDIVHVKGSPAVMFGANEERNGYIWQIVLNEDKAPVLKRSKQQYSSYFDFGEAQLSQFSSNDLLKNKFTIKLDIKGGNTIDTYINDILVDSYKVESGLVYIERFGVCDKSDTTGEIYLDNVQSTLNLHDGSTMPIVDDDFEKPFSSFFPDAQIADVESGRMVHLKGSGSGYTLLYLKSKSPVLYHAFNLSKPIKSAFLHSSANGVFDVFVNGNRVGHQMPDGTTRYDELKPEWTDYLTRTHYYTYEISNLLQDGDNIIGALVSPGWVIGSISKDHYTTKGIPFCSFIGKLVITYTDGTSETIVSNDQWKTSHFSPLLRGEIYEGEYYDSKYKWPWDDNYEIPPFNVLTTEYDGELVSFSGYGIRALDTIAPVNVTVYEGIKPGSDYGVINVVDVKNGNASFTLKKGQTAIYDFGQNFAAIPSLTVRSSKPTRVQMRFAEILNDSGSKARNNDGPKGSIYRKNMRFENVAKLYYVTSGTASESYCPTSTYYGYRYIEVTASDDIEIASMVSRPLSSSYADEGYIETDNDDINRLFGAVMWGQKSNYVGIPTDCPSRNERLGWTGDVQLFAPTALYNANVSELLRKWLGAMRDCQRADGAYPEIAPQCFDRYGIGAWSDAGIIVAWHLYLSTGNIDIVKENYNSMCRYIDFLKGKTDGALNFPGGDTLYGDWVSLTETNSRFVSQAMYAYDAKLMAKMAAALSETDDCYREDVIKFESLFDEIRDEIQRVYFYEHGLLNPTQTACSLILSLGLYADEGQQHSITSQLEALLLQSSSKIDTGFVGTQYICPALSENGLNSLAYELLLQRQYPSWLYCIDQGATTLWERWDSYTKEKGIDKSIINSFNHYAFGTVVEWMYRYMAGISTDEDAPGFKKTIFRPYPNLNVDGAMRTGGIRSLRASTHTPYGDVFASWSINDDSSFDYHIVVPANTEAVVELPKVADDCVVYESDCEIEQVEGIEFIEETDDRIVYSVPSGEFNFSVRNGSDSINDLSINIINQCYPNPTSDYINIESNVPISNMYLISPTGAILRTWSHSTLQTSSIRLDLSSLPSGVYVLLINTTIGQDAKRIIKI